MAEKKVDLLKFVTGSGQMNREKEEIRLVLSFLYQYFADLTRPESYHLRKAEGLAPLERGPVFGLYDDKSNYLSLNMGCGAFTLAYSSAREDGEFTELVSTGTIRPKVEALRIHDVGACHGLMTPLLEKMIGYYPLIERQLEAFYAATERFWEQPVR